MNYKDQGLPDYQFEGKPLTQSIVKQILMQRAELPDLTTEEWGEYVRDCCGENEEKPLEKDLRTIVAKALISLDHERLARQKVSLDHSTSQWKVFREQYTLPKKTTVADRGISPETKSDQRAGERLLNRLRAFLEESPDNYQPKLFYSSEQWRKYSKWYRNKQGWECEVCKLLLDSDPWYLDVHHTRGREYNDPEDLQALCVGCHSERHQRRVGEKERYDEFEEKYGKQWQLRNGIA